jgi:tetratricopeptide (TPR) repeat protein
MRLWLLIILIPITFYAITPDAQNALRHFERISGDPLSTENLFSRATMLCELHEYNFALELYKQLAQRLPHSIHIKYNQAYTLKMAGHFNHALLLYTEILKKEPTNVSARIGLSHCLLALGNYKQGLPFFESRLIRKDMYQTGPIILNTLRDKKVLLLCESGIGDQIQCIRYASLLKEHGAIVIAQTYESLVPLFKHCPFIDMVITKQNAIPPHDYAFYYFSLPLICGTQSEATIPRAVPYLTTQNSLTQSWKTKIQTNNKFKIGLSWHAKDQDASFEFSPYRKRSIPLTDMAPLASVNNAIFYSLQKITGLDELHNVPKIFNIITFDTDFDESNGRFMDTASLMLNLDLVITVDTAVAHLAGALGVTTWLLLPKTADWRWGIDRTDSAWYPSMRLFRQKHAGNWNEVIEEVKETLMHLQAKAL